jgi:ABC-2 type transport system permease protein
LAGAAWLGMSTGLAIVRLPEPVDPWVFIPAPLNVFALGAFLAGISTMISAASDMRSRTIGIVGGLYAVSMILKIVGRLVPDWHWVSYTSFFTPYEPQLLVSGQVNAWSFWSQPAGVSMALGGLGYDAVLIGLGLAGYLVAAVIFCRRDLPAPL